MNSSSSQAQSRAAYLESKKQKEKLALDQQKMIHEKKQPLTNSVSPFLISEEEAKFVSLPIKSELIESETQSEKVTASLSSFEEALSTSLGSTSVRPRSVPFPKFEEWK